MLLELALGSWSKTQFVLTDTFLDVEKAATAKIAKIDGESRC